MIIRISFESKKARDIFIFHIHLFNYKIFDDRWITKKLEKNKVQILFCVFLIDISYDLTIFTTNDLTT